MGTGFASSLKIDWSNLKFKKNEIIFFKKTRIYFKIFGQNRIQKFVQVKNVGKTGENPRLVPYNPATLAPYPPPQQPILHPRSSLQRWQHAISRFG
jgi:hypothetical protein